MTKILTFQPAIPARRFQRWAIAAAAALIAFSAPVAACEKSIVALIAGPQRALTIPVEFTGEFVNGAPVYRFPSITVVTRRDAEFATAPREASQARAARPLSPAKSTPSTKRKVASGLDEPAAGRPCIG